MADYLTLIGTISAPFITGIFGYFIANHNSKSVLKQKMLDKDVEKNQQKEVYEEKLESLKLKHEQELKIIGLTHKNFLDQLEAETKMKLAAAEGEAKIKNDSAETEKIQKYTEQLLNNVMSSSDGMAKLFAASAASQSGASDEEIVKLLIGDVVQTPPKKS